MQNIQISYPWYFIIVIVFIALLYAAFLYFRDKRLNESKPGLSYILGFLRFLSILGILFLLLVPLFKNLLSDQQNPIIVIAQDKSASINNATDNTTIESLNIGLENLVSKLDGDYDFVHINFAERLDLNRSDSIANQSSNLSAPLEYISDAYEDQNLGAIVFVSDGIYNEGKNPLYTDLSISAPLYAIPLGDTTTRKDLVIKNVLHNRIAYLKDRFLVEVDIQAYNSSGESARVSISKIENGQGRIIDSKNLTFNKNDQFESVQFELEANEVGNNKYVVSISRKENEISYSNNSRNVYIEVLDARQKILILANAPHPDLKSLKTVINSNRNYEAEIQFVKDFQLNLKTYDLIVLHDLPSSKYPSAIVMDQISKLKMPALFILGANTSVSDFNAAQDVINLTGSSNNLNSITPVIKSNFNLFTLSDNFSSTINKFVPLKNLFGDYKLKSGTQVLLNQQIGNIETEFPLLSFNDYNNHRQAILCGEGIWRWRLIEYAENENHDVTDELVMKTLQYISQKEDKRPFKAFSNKRIYKENESILFDAQLYNASFEAINTPEAFLKIRDEAGKVYDYTFTRSNEYYVLDAGRFPEGNYNYTANTNFNGKDLNSSESFSIQSIVKEQYDLTAKHDLLFNLSQKYNGQLVYPEDISNLTEIISSNETIKPIVYQKTQTEPLLNLKWLLGILILLLAIEWFFRRYFGAY